MKVVINAGYGGFGLSARALKRIAVLKGRPCYFFVSLSYPTVFTPATVEEADAAPYYYAFDVPNPYDVLGDPTSRDVVAYNKRYAAHYIGDDMARHDAALLQVIEELGSSANGAHAHLAVIEIPDGTNYIIDSHDGAEHIDEVGHTWPARESSA